MGAGTRNELVTVERETRVSDRGGGGRPVWTAVGQLWAEVRWVGGGESARQGAVRESARYRFVVLYSDVESVGVTASDRLVWNGEPYNIRERPRRQTRGILTDIFAESGVTQ